jgi:hypothetical protein
MSIPDNVRKAYEEGVERRNESVIDTVLKIASIGGAAVEGLRDMSRSDSERAAFEKGLAGKQLDSD